MKKTFKYQQFDIIKFFDEYDIPYTTNGKNISQSWIAIDECPFCGIQGNHFGINIASKSFFCWGCGEKGSLLVLLKNLLNIPTFEAYKIINKFQDNDLEFKFKETGNKVIFPKNIIDLQKSGAKYLTSRNFNPFYIRDKFGIQQTGHSAILNYKGHKVNFKNRLFIPIKMNHQIVSYTARDYTGKQEPKYLHVFIEACKIPPSSCLYNIDTIKDKCIIVEGPTDVWRLGDGAISLQGIQHTKEQIRFIGEKKLKKAIILFDSGKEEDATKLAKIINAVVPEVRVAYLDKGDPGELSDTEALKIKQELLT